MSDYLIGYGSLLSSYSRKYYSNITSHVQALTLHGWQRSWCARYADEGATYSGAMPNSQSKIDGVLIPTKIDPALVQREREYRFTEVNLDQIKLSGKSNIKLSDDDTVLVCESLNPLIPNQDHPIVQSYIDTCLIGSLEVFGEVGALSFIENTSGWDHYWVNDRDRQPNPIYQRLTPCSAKQTKKIDELLDRAGALGFRKQSPQNFSREKS